MLVSRDDIKVFDNYAEITIKNKHGEIAGIAKIDIDICDIFSGMYITVMSNGYINARKDGVSIGIHRLITDAPKGMQVDHINGDRSDNRKCNLRICTASENFRNRVKDNRNTSGHRGVTWNKHLKNPKWMVHICVHRKRMTVGYYNTLEDAIEARRKAEERYFGEYAPTDERWNAEKYPLTK